MTLEEFKNRLMTNNVSFHELARDRYGLSAEQIVIAFEETSKRKRIDTLLDEISYLSWSSNPHGILYFNESQIKRLQKVMGTSCIEKIINSKKESKKQIKKDILLNIDKIVCAIQDDDLMLKLANYIKKTNDADIIVEFVKKCTEHKANIPDNALEVLTPLVIATKDSEKILEYAKNISYISSLVVCKNLTDAIILTNDLNKIYDFALNFPGANKEKIARTFIDSKSLKLVYNFAKNIGEIPENVTNQLATFVSQTNLPEFIYLFASKISMSDDNLILLGQAIKRTENTELISYFLLGLGNSKSEKLNSIKHELRMYLEKYGNNDWMIKCDCNLADKLETALLESSDEKENPFVPDDDAKIKNLI